MATSEVCGFEVNCVSFDITLSLPIHNQQNMQPLTWSIKSKNKVCLSYMLTNIYKENEFKLQRIYPTEVFASCIYSSSVRGKGSASFATLDVFTYLLISGKCRCVLWNSGCLVLLALSLLR